MKKTLLKVLSVVMMLAVVVTAVVIPNTTAKAATDYYLFGWINGADYACAGDSENLGDYKFVNGTLTATFDSDSYIAVKTGDNKNWYMCQSYVGSGTTATFYTGCSEKAKIPGGIEYKFTLTENNDGSITLNWEATTQATYYVAGTMNGWTTNDASKMTCTDGTYTWTTSLEAGEYEF